MLGWLSDRKERALAVAAGLIRNRSWAVAAALLASVAVTGCGPSLSAPFGGGSGPAPDRVTIIQGQHAAAVDAHLQGGMLNSNPALHIMEPLMMRNDRLEMIPWLATAWNWADPRTLTFEIRPGVRFHDGTLLTADDVKFTFERVMDETVNSSHYTYINPSVIDRIETNGERRVTFHLNAPQPYILQHFFQVGIASRAAVGEMGAALHARNPVGTGPYRLQEWKPGIHIRLQKYDRWWAGDPGFDVIEWRGVSEDSTRVAELLTGRADLITSLPPSAIRRVEEHPRTAFKSSPSLRSVWMRINTRREPLDDPRVREALNLAVDVESIVSFVLEGYGLPIPSVIGPQVFGYSSELPPVPHDPGRARELLSEAGYGGGLELKLAVREGRLVKELEVAEAVVSHLHEAGVRVGVQIVDHERYLQDAWHYTDEFDLFMSSNANNSADAHWNLALNFHSGSRGLYWSDPELDDLIDAAAVETDEPQRLDLYHRSLALIRREWPVIFLYNQVDLYGVREDLVWSPRPDDFIYLPGVDRP